MVKVKIIKSKEIKEVTRSEAHTLIEEGDATLDLESPEAEEKKPSEYRNKMMLAKKKK